MKYTLCLIVLLGINLFPTVQAQISINEMMSANSQTLEDEDGDSSDWVEIYNDSNDSVSLENYYLSDDIYNLQKWAFPELILAPKSYLIVYCSGKDRNSLSTPLHTNFKIKAEGEDLILSLYDETLQLLPATELTDDISLAAFPNGSQHFLKTSIPSPAYSNISDLSITFSHPAGFYNDAIAVALSVNDLAINNIEIRYTTNGDEPTLSDLLYTQSIQLSDRSVEENTLSIIPSTPDFSDWEGEAYYPAWAAPSNKIAKANIIRTAIFKEGQKISNTQTNTYFVFPEGQESYQFPVISLSCPRDSLFSHERGIYVPGAALRNSNLLWSGNYFKSGSDWERKSNLEYFEEGELVLDQTMGIRIHGGKTRGAAQKSFRLYARSEYGKKEFDYPFFKNKEQTKYKRLLLRTSMGAWTHTIFADAFAHQSVRDLHLDIQEYQPVIVFLNGEYWGIYSLREYINHHKIAADHNIDKDKVTIYSSYGSVIQGAEDNTFIYLRDVYLRENDIRDPSVYEYITERIDIDNLIDYLFTEIFYNNVDWPANNSKMWRSSAYDNKFRWLLYDLDGAFGEHRISVNFLEKVLANESDGNAEEWASFLYKTLLQNDTFKQKFINRSQYLLQEVFSASRLAPLVNEMKNEYQQETAEHFDRWEDWQSAAMWEERVDIHIENFVKIRACEMEQHLIDFFSIAPFLRCTEETPKGETLYPNPSDGMLTIVLDHPHETPYRLIAYNQLGIVVADQVKAFNSNKISLDLSRFPVGVYYVSLYDHSMKKVVTEKVIIY